MGWGDSMDSQEFEELFKQARQLTGAMRTLFREVTGEELDLEAAIRHYPLVTLGIAAGAGALGGWWVGRKSRPQLAPPEPKRNLPSGNPLGYIEQLFPEGIDKVKNLLPESISEEAADMAKTWVDDVLEPKFREGLETVVGNVSETKFGLFFKQALQHLESHEDHDLEDPEGA